MLLAKPQKLLGRAVMLSRIGLKDRILPVPVTF